jgi:hypothetical protein
MESGCVSERMEERGIFLNRRSPRLAGDRSLCRQHQLDVVPDNDGYRPSDSISVYESEYAPSVKDKDLTSFISGNQYSHIAPSGQSACMYVVICLVSESKRSLKGDGPTPNRDHMFSNKSKTPL